MVGSKHAFWQALIFTIIVFSMGLIIGFFIENNRQASVELNVLNSEISLLDEQIKSRDVEIFNLDCAQSKKNILQFADKIYDEALLMEEYDGSSKFSGTLKIIHKRYDLLRALLWIEGIQFKEKCGDEFHTVVYIFEYSPEETMTKAEQAATGRLLRDLKEKNGDKILLIPLAGNLNISSIDIVMQKNKIQKLPAIIIDEKHVIDHLPTMEELESLIFE